VKRPIETLDNVLRLARGASNSLAPHVAFSRFGLLGCHALAVKGISSRDTRHVLPVMQDSDAKKETNYAAGIQEA
jgi:hypothetical protein